MWYFFSTFERNNQSFWTVILQDNQWIKSSSSLWSNATIDGGMASFKRGLNKKGDSPRSRQSKCSLLDRATIPNNTPPNSISKSSMAITIPTEATRVLLRKNSAIASALVDFSVVELTRLNTNMKKKVWRNRQWCLPVSALHSRTPADDGMFSA